MCTIFVRYLKLPYVSQKRGQTSQAFSSLPRRDDIGASLRRQFCNGCFVRQGGGVIGDGAMTRSVAEFEGGVDIRRMMVAVMAKVIRNGGI